MTHHHPPHSVSPPHDPGLVDVRIPPTRRERFLCWAFDHRWKVESAKKRSAICLRCRRRGWAKWLERRYR